MSEQFYRLSCKRQHRIIGHYLAVQSWLQGLDCIVLDRPNLEYFLGLKRFKSTRVTWLREDLKPWFLHQVHYVSSKSESSIHSLFLARVPIEAHLPQGRMTTDQRVKGMKPDAPKTKQFYEVSAGKPPTEADMISQLAMISCGVAVPQDFRSAEKSKAIPAPEPFFNSEIFQAFFVDPILKKS